MNVTVLVIKAAGTGRATGHQPWLVSPGQGKETKTSSMGGFERSAPNTKQHRLPQLSRPDETSVKVKVRTPMPLEGCRLFIIGHVTGLCWPSNVAPQRENGPSPPGCALNGGFSDLVSFPVGLHS